MLQYYPRAKWLMGLYILLTIATLDLLCGDQALAQLTEPPSSATEATLPTLQLLDVNSDDFPTVSLLVDITGVETIRPELGPQGLVATDFQISEDRRPIDAANMALSVDQSQGLSLILLLDKSTEPANWAEIQGAIQALLAALQPQDSLAVITYNEQALLLFPFQNDWASSQASLNAVAPGGSFSALNPAVVNALQLAQGAPTPRRAILVFGDSPDNISTTPSFFDAVAQAQQAQIPIYLFGYGEKMLTFPEVQSLSTSSGGRAFISTTAAEIATSVSELVPTLRSAYRLTYLSQLQADNQSHAVSVSLPALGLSATSSSQIEARTGTVTVSIPNITPGQRVGGDVNLTAIATAPAPIVSVRYLLNGSELLADVDDIGYSIIWDSTTANPGTHQLDVTVTDSVGNVGQTSLQFDVVAPLTLSILPPQPQVGETLQADSEIRLEAEVGAHDGVNRVEFFVDRVLAGTLTEAPYQVFFKTEGFTPGQHTITVRVSDKTGREVTDTLDFQLAAAAGQLPTNTETADAPTTDALATESSSIIGTALGSILSFLGQSLRFLFYLLLAVALAFILFLGGRWLRTPRPQEPLTVCRIALANTGNIASHYIMRAEERTGALSFSLQVGGHPLQPPMLHRLAQPQASAGMNGYGQVENSGVGHRNGAVRLASNGIPAAQTYSQPQVNGQRSALPQGYRVNVPGVNIPGANVPNISMPNVSMPTAKVPNVEGLNPGAVNLQDAGDTVDEAMVISRAIADLLTTVAYLLPSSLGRPVRSLATTLRRGQMMGRRFQRAQKQIAKLRNVSEGTKTAAGASKVASAVGDIATAEATHNAAQHAAGSVSNIARGAYTATASGLSQTADRLQSAGDLQNIGHFESTGHSFSVGPRDRDLVMAADRTDYGPYGLNTHQEERADGSSFEGGAIGHRAFGGSATGPENAGLDNTLLSGAQAQGWVETPYVMPGQTLTVEIVVQLETKFARATQVPFRIYSRSVDDADASTVVEDGAIQVPSTSWLNRQISMLPLLRATRFATLWMLAGLSLIGVASEWLG